MTQPVLILVTGPPATGKTTVARELARRLGVPAVAKDVFKERLYETFGSSDALEPRIEEAAVTILFSVVEAQLEAGASVLAESNFDERHRPSILRLVDRHPHRLVQIHCSKPAEEVAARFAERAASGDRHPGHGDDPDDAAEVAAETEAGRYDPLDLPGTLIEHEPGVDAVHALAADVAASAGGDH